ncbi:MAG: hypothetical protein V1907_00970 [Candidatus Kerfeldbacteria bacterium]
MKYLSIAFIVVALGLLGFSCKNSVVSVNVNVNAAAKTVTNTVNAVNSPGVKGAITKNAAIAQAKAVFIAQEGQGVDFTEGPCLTNSLLSDWVADVAHNPRTSVDDLAENQCSAYRNGTAHHFVELDPEGQLIRAE